MLTNKKLLLTGVITRDSIAWEAARRAQEAGAEIVLTSFGRARRLTERAAKSLPETVRRARARRQQPRRPRGGRRQSSRSAGGGSTAILHAIAFAPEDALGGQFLTTPAQSAITAFQTSAFSLKALAVALADLYPEEGASIVGMDFDASVAWPVYDWMGVAKAALEATLATWRATSAPAACASTSCRPGRWAPSRRAGSPASRTSPRCGASQAPIGWDGEDAGPVADAVLFLLSDLSEGSPARSSTSTAAFTPWARRCRWRAQLGERRSA